MVAKKFFIFTLFFGILLQAKNPLTFDSLVQNESNNKTDTFSAFKAACLSKPEQPTHFQEPVVSWAKFNALLTQAAQEMDSQYQEKSWLGAKPNPVSLETESDFKPFVQKLDLPEKSNVLIFGDLHGCVHGLVKSLDELRKTGVIDDNFKIIKPDTHMLFLGDYVDRGAYGVEVIYTLLKLKHANPDRVFLVRGNHEDCNINQTSFEHELAAKFKGENYQKLYRFYDLLPVAIYLGTNKKYTQCCHGGMEIGYNPKNLLCAQSAKLEEIKEYKRAEQVQKLSTDLQQAVHQNIPAHARKTHIPEPENTGFMWHDFIVDQGQEVVGYNRGRGWVYGKKLTQAVCEQASAPEQDVHLCGAIGAHQHNGKCLEIMNQHGGRAQLYNGLVEKFYSCQEMYHKPGEKAACWLLETAAKREDWKFKKVV